MPASQTFTADHYLVRRKVLKLVGGAFYVFDQNTNIVAFSEQKAFKLKEDIRVYADEAKSTEILSIQARQIIDWSAAYDVFDSTTQDKVGALRRRGARSLLRDEWHVLDAADVQIGVLVEDSMALAILRRFIGLIPQRYDVFMPDAETGQKVASLDQNFNPFVYKLNADFSFDPQGRLDRRLGVAAAILLAAIEGKQS
jgi:hypothetical protein